MPSPLCCIPISAIVIPMRSSWTIPFAILAAGAILALSVYLYVSQNAPATQTSSAGNPALIPPIGTSDHVFGNPTAPIQIIEYADFDSPYSAQFQTTLHQLLATEGTKGQVAWALRQLPLIELHPNAVRHAEAAECAGRAGGNDAFWRFADLLFAGQPTDPATYGILAAKAGVPADAFVSCMTSNMSQVDAHITSERTTALSAGAHGTPYAILLSPGKIPVVIQGAYSYDAMRQLLNQALSALPH